MITLNDKECLPLLEAARARFMKKVGPITSTGCMEWQGKVDAHRYGTVCILPISKYVKAHRAAWVLANGEIPVDSPVIRHSCDNPRCVNPAHLVCGTQTDNNMDTLNHGRTKGGAWEGHRLAKLDRTKVAEIKQRRARGESCASLGREYGVGRDQISRICTGKVWRPHSIRLLEQVSAG